MFKQSIRLSVVAPFLAAGLASAGPASAQTASLDHNKQIIYTGPQGKINLCAPNAAVGLAKKLGEAEMATYAKTKNIQPMEAKVQALIQEDSSISQAMAKHNAALRNQGKDPASPVARISLLASVIGQYTIESQVKKATGGTDGNPIRWCKEHPAPAAPRR